MYSDIYTICLVFEKAGKTLWTMAPYIIAGVVAGELLKYVSWTKSVCKGASKSTLLSIPIAVLLGMVSPLCTYGTVPVTLQLYSAGFPLAPLMAFLFSSSMMNPQLFIMTWGGIGPEMAIARAVSVFLIALLMGLIILFTPISWIINKKILPSNNQTPDEIRNDILSRRLKTFRWRDFITSILKNLEFIGFYIVIGAFLGSLLEVFVPSGWIISVFRPGYWLSILIAALFGVPLYTCGGGTIPLIRSFMHQGMSEGAALAFFLTGSATRITPLMAMAAFLKISAVVIYVVLLVLFSLIIGLVYR